MDTLGGLHEDTAEEINRCDGTANRTVWFNFWDTKLTFETSYLARLNYVHQNAVKHGLDGTTGRVMVSIVAQDAGSECLIEVEDDGSGSDPEKVRRALAGESESGSMALANVDARLRATYGDDHGLVVETGPGAGTKVSLRVPKYQAGVRAS